MLTLLIIAGYIASVFLCRWSNKIIYKKFKGSKPWGIWLMPMFNMLVFIGVLIEMLNIPKLAADFSRFIDNKFFKRIKSQRHNKFFRWFRGDNW